MKIDFYLSLIIFYYWKLIGLCPFYLDNKELIKRSKTGTIYTLILGIVFIICFCRIAVLRIASELFDLNTLLFCIDYFGLFLELVLNIIVWIYAIIYQNNVRQLLKSSKNIIKVTISLGIELIYHKYFRRIHFIVVICNLGFISLICYDHIFSHWGFKEIEFFSWIIFNFLRCISMNIIIIYYYAIKIIKLLFEFINNSLSILPDADIFINIQNEIKRIRLNPREVDIQLKELAKLHLDLKDLVKMLNELFSLPILIVFIMHFSQSILNTYNILLFISVESYHPSKKTITGTMGWLILRLIQIFNVMNICDSTCREANRKAIVLHELWASKRSEVNRNMLKNLSIQLLQQPMEINLYDSLRLNHQLIMQMSGIITTCLVIMMQIDKSKFF